MVKKGSPAPTIPPEMQTPIDFIQAAPVQNTWYEVLPITRNCRLISVSARVYDTGETLEVRIIVDGSDLTWPWTAAANTWYMAKNMPEDLLFLMETIAATDRASHTFLYEGRSVRILIRKTTAAGAGNLRCLIHYATW